MDEEMLFSLSYEQMTQMAEEEIKQCDFRREGVGGSALPRHRR
nr:hypothetical protein [Klebsiella pneumoniae]